ncbi:hypothetical protein ALC56_07753 [Trachymyrmex septentrionalis]|uniref:Uncharacterized protein n=1 Tax=Trachymyrmex septentrionalis TaxID=34720 RepID=A0A195FAA3_9HYME|nr:hypothetical protein ALC56_07753 [Trachymyrmex septentrionalis]
MQSRSLTEQPSPVEPCPVRRQDCQLSSAFQPKVPVPKAFRLQIWRSDTHVVFSYANVVPRRAVAATAFREHDCVEPLPSPPSAAAVTVRTRVVTYRRHFDRDSDDDDDDDDVDEDEDAGTTLTLALARERR